MQNSKFGKTFNFSLSTFNYQGGQSLFEIVVAIGISALIIVALVSLVTNSIRNSNFSKNKALAATYAQQATEWLRGQRDGDITTFMAKTDTAAPYCLQYLTWVDHVACGTRRNISGTPFARQATFSVTTENGKKIVKADVTVSWTDAQGTHEAKSVTNLADLR